MEKKILSIVYQEFKTDEELEEADRQLLREARKNLPAAYAPYSGFLVAAAVRLANDAILSGSNQENAAYPMCLCAERVALAAAAAAYPGVPVVAIAVTVKSRKKLLREPATPCGACRQVLCETEDRHRRPVEILLQGEAGPILKFFSARDLLPLAFNGSTLLDD